MCGVNRKTTAHSTKLRDYSEFCTNCAARHKKIKTLSITAAASSSDKHRSLVRIFRMQVLAKDFVDIKNIPAHLLELLVHLVGPHLQVNVNIISRHLKIKNYYSFV